VLTIRGLRKSFAGIAPQVLFENLDLELAAGEFIAIMGESGSGKSTLLNLVAGLDLPDAGSIRFDSHAVAQMTEDERAAFRRMHLGFVFQAFHLLPYLSVADNAALPLVLCGVAASERAARVEDMLARVGLSHRAQSRPHELSGGEMQRVAIARALIHRPQLVLADEPTGNLDAQHAAEVLALLRSQTEASAAGCILVTHSTTAARAADRIYVLSSTGLQLDSTRCPPPPS
jgi:putative ABC transport system ATP-binding protein